MSPIFLLVSLAAVVLAVGDHVLLANATGVSWTPSATEQSTCDQSTFVFDETFDPADWRECAALSSTWVSENGTFRVVNKGAKTFVPVIQQRDCTLAVEPTGAKHGTYTIGDKDVKSILENSLKNFSSGTLLAVKGVVMCDVNGGGRGALTWRISKTGKGA